MRYFIVFYFIITVVGNKIYGTKTILSKTYINYDKIVNIINNENNRKTMLTNIIELNKRDYKEWVKDEN